MLTAECFEQPCSLMNVEKEIIQGNDKEFVFMSTQAQSLVDRMVFRNTHAHVGRHILVNPSNSTNRHLAYGRIILNRSTPPVSFANADRETSLICLSGAATVKTGGD